MRKRGYSVIILIIIMLLSSCAGDVQESSMPDTMQSEPGSEEPETPVTEPEPEEPETPPEEPHQTPPEPVEEPSDPNLIAHWKFDSNAEDSANGHDGTIKGRAAFKTGKISNALYFDGVDDYVDMPSFEDIGSLAQGTIAFWFNYESMLDKQTVMPIFYIGGDERDQDNIFIIEIGHFDERTPQALAPDNKKLYVTWIKDNKDPFLCYDSDVNLEENKWHHFALVVSPSGNTGYLNSAEMINRHYNFGNSKNPSFLDDIPGKKKLMLGYGRSAKAVGADFVYYKGLIDDLRIYNRPLTSSEIQELI